MPGLDLKLLREESQNEAQLAGAKQIRQGIQNEQAQRQIKRLVKSQCLPIFNTAIVELYKMLVDCKNRSGEKLVSDFPDPQNPSIYYSNLMRDGEIVSGTNSMALGTNDVWDFKISTGIRDPLQPWLRIGGWSWLNPRHPFLRIAPQIHSDSEYTELWIVASIFPSGIRNQVLIKRVRINHSDPNVYTVQELPSSIPDSTAAVKGMLRTLISEVDSNAPLPLLANQASVKM